MAKHDDKDGVNFADGEKVITGGEIGSITVNPGFSVTIKAGTSLGKHVINYDQLLSNTTDTIMQAVFNDEANAFELQPVGAIAD